ncbi:zinc finger protein 287-like isoform X2 [Biomphalaria glabrata]|uniref:Zinc finger protein 287-like isoform X2 n=1 Tax=Biomphalaria glabrata TaxID=6526 RepID=A0A9W3BFQ5_BIOGL|nr:zinc finger protein 287-like isoform X2 [Biomphalaria glabrata]
MAGTGYDSTLDLSNVLKHVKKEMDETDLLTQPCEEQDFKVPMIKIEKSGDKSYAQQSENCAQDFNVNFEYQENIVKQEIEMNDPTDSRKPFSLASRFLAVSRKGNNSLCPVPIILPKFELLSHVQAPEVSLCEVRFIDEDKEKTVKSDTIQDQLEQCHPVETVLSKETNFVTGKKTIQFKCQICLKEFSQSANLKMHHLIHATEKPFKCQICLKQFSTSFNLKNHQWLHMNEKPFKCQTCLKEFSRSDYLKRHQLIHSGEKPFKCQICQRGFTDPSCFKRHQSIHTGEKKFKCQICQKDFTDCSCFKRHQCVHTGEKKFKLKELIQSSALKTHYLSRTHKKLFKCQICLKEFSQSSHLKNHQQTHNSLNKIKMLLCQRGVSK